MDEEGYGSVPSPHRVIALLGPDGAGKRTLTRKVADLYGGRIGILPITTTRPPSTRPSDMRFFTQVTGLRFMASSVGGMLLDTVEHQGDKYGYDRVILEEGLRNRDLIAPMRPEAVVALRQGGYTVHTVRVVAKRRSGKPIFAGDDDPFLRASAFRADMTLENIFDERGLNMAVGHLVYLVGMWTGVEPANYPAFASL